MTSSSLFSELAMALKRTIIPITPYQSQNNKSEPPSTGNNTGLVGTNSTTFGTLNKEKQNKSNQNTDSNLSKLQPIKDIDLAGEKTETRINGFGIWNFECTNTS